MAIPLATDPLERRARAVHRALEEAGWNLGLSAVYAVLHTDRLLGSRLEVVDAILERLNQEAKDRWQMAVTDALVAMRDMLAGLTGQPPIMSMPKRHPADDGKGKEA